MQDNISPSTIRLCIPGLPSLTDRMMNGGLYALIAATPPARFPILASSLAGALRENVPCTVILPAQAEAFIERIDSFGQSDSGDALAAGSLQVFTLQDNFAKNMFRFGAESFARELSDFEIPANSYLIFDQADELFSLHDISLAMEQVEILRQWFDEAQVTALLVFSRLTVPAADTLQAMMDQLSGIVRIGGDRAGLELVFDYWKSPEGTIAAKQHPLTTLENGLYKVAGRPVAADRREAETETVDAESRFFYMDPDLGSLAKQMPGNWQHIDSLVGMMHATRGTHSPTVILSFRRDTGLRELAEAVHTLRLSLGRRARIVVRETGASLRYQNEALLLRLGVNLVVHRDVVASRLPLLLSSLDGQIFDRNVDINFEAALASVMPSPLRGYMLPGRFVREVETIIQRSATLDIPCALVVGRPAPSVAIADIMASINMARPGDLNTSDGESCYMFFSGCPESVLLMTMERILGQPVDTLFSESRFVIRSHEIRSELDAVSRAAERSALANAPDAQTQGPHTDAPGSATAGAPTASAPQAAVRQAVAPPVKTPAILPRGSIAAASEPAASTPRPAPSSPASAPSSPAPAPSTPPPAPLVAPPAPPAAAPAATADRPSFKYSDNANDSTFGRKDAPRATRAAKNNASQLDLRKTPTGTK